MFAKVCQMNKTVSFRKNDSSPLQDVTPRRDLECVLRDQSLSQSDSAASIEVDQLFFSQTWAQIF